MFNVAFEQAHHVVRNRTIRPRELLIKKNAIQSCILFLNRGRGGGAVAQSVKRSTPGEEIPGSIPAVAARSLLVMLPAKTEVMVSQLCLVCGST